jgi:hypothetical protein
VDDDEDKLCDVCGEKMPLPEGVVLVENGTSKFQIVVAAGV